MNTQNQIHHMRQWLEQETTPFEEKTAYLAKELNHVIDTTDDKSEVHIKAQELLMKLEDLVAQRLSFKHGFDELKECIEESGLDDPTRAIFNKILDGSLDHFQAPVITAGIRPEVFVKLRTVVQAHGLDETKLYYGKALDGTYFAVYDGQIQKQFEEIMRETQYNLGTLNRPDAEHIITFAKNTYNHEDANITKIDGLTPELAEKMIEIGGFKNNIPFAKNNVIEENGKIGVITRTGEMIGKAPIADTRFASVCKILLDSSIELSGEKGKKEVRNVHVREAAAKEITDAIRAVSQANASDLEGGYIFSIHAHHALDENGQEIHSSNTDIPYIDDYIVFDKEKFIRFDNGRTFDSVFANVERTGYEYSLRLAAFAGDGEVEKRYVSKENYHAIEEKAKHIADNVLPLYKGSSYEETRENLQKAFADRQELARDYKNHSPEAKRAREEEKEIEALMAHFENKERSGLPFASEDQVRDIVHSVVACEIYATKTKAYTFTNDIKSERAFKNWVDQSFDYIKDDLTTGNIYATKDILNGFVNGLDRDDFLRSEWDRVQSGEITQKMYLHEEAYFTEERFESFKQEINEKLCDVSFGLENVDRNPLYEKNVDMENFNRYIDRSFLRNEELIKNEQKTAERTVERDVSRPIAKDERDIQELE